MKFHVPEMSCGHCVATIKEAVLAADPSASLQVDLNARMAEIASDMSYDKAIQVLAEAGYEATPSQNHGRT